MSDEMGIQQNSNFMLLQGLPQNGVKSRKVYNPWNENSAL